MSQVQLRRIFLTVVVVVVAGSGAAACSRPSAGLGGAGAGGPESTTTPTAAAAADDANARSVLGGSSAAPPDGSGSGGHTTGSSNSGPPVVTIKLAPVSDVNSPNCPLPLTVHGTVSVDKGPIQVTARISMSNVAEGPTDKVLNFTGNGPQSMDVSLTGTVLGLGATNTVDLVLVKHAYVANPSEVQYKVNCGGKPSAVTPVSAVKPCPFTTSFGGTITVPIAQTVTYEWAVSNGGTVPGGTLTFTDAGSKPVSINNITVNTQKVLNDFVVGLRVTSPGGGYATGAAKCSSYKAP
jgi:hypothetical protein